MTKPKIDNIYHPSILRIVWSFLLFPLARVLHYLVWFATRTSKRSDNPFLQGVFEPIYSESFLQSPLPVKVTFGSIPKNLGSGIFLRNGPNPKQIPDGLYHWFDGDGMIHGVRIRQSNSTIDVNYVHHLIQTDRMIEESRLGHDVYFKIGWSLSTQFALIARTLCSIFITLIGYAKGLGSLRGGSANTSLEVFEGKLLATNESALPFQLLVEPDGWISSMGYQDFQGSLDHNMTAHPKVMSDGEMRFIGYTLEKAPHCKYSTIKHGMVQSTMTIDKDQLPRAVMMHDFMVTENYSVIMDFPLIFDMEKAKRGILPIAFQPDEIARFGVFEKDSTNSGAIQWFTVQTCYMFHSLNSWEMDNGKGERVIWILGCRLKNFSLRAFKNTSFTRPYLWILNLSTGQLDYEGSLIPDDSNDNCLQFSADFPRCHPSLLGKPCRFGYFSLFDETSNTPKSPGFLKLDLAPLLLGRDWTFSNPPPKCPYTVTFYGAPDDSLVGGECFYQPAIDGSAEDDGYLMTLVHKSALPYTSEFWILSAREGHVVAKVSIPVRVPFGFHCRWMTENELITQMK